MKNRIFFFGFPKSGKTYFGKLLAEMLHLPFFDTDQLIEKLYADEHKNPLSGHEIIKTKGLSFFRLLEKRVILSLEKIEKGIISLGGGAILDQENRTLLEKLGTLVYLKADKQTLKQKILLHKLPAIFDEKNPEKSFEELYEKRELLYNSIPSVRIETKGKTDAEILTEIKQNVYGK